MLMHPAPSSETSRVPSLRFFMALAPLRSPLADHASGAATSPAPTRAVLASRLRRVSAGPRCSDSRGVVCLFIGVLSEGLIGNAGLGHPKKNPVTPHPL